MSPWFGSVLAGGFVFDEALLGRARVVERLLAAWTDGARLAKQDSRWYLVGVTPRRVDARTAPGAPLVWREGRWLSAPVSTEELAHAAIDSILELRGGALQVVAFGSLEAVHPASLIDVAKPRVELSETLEPPARRVVARAAPQAQTLEELFAPLVSALNERPRPPDAPVAAPRPTLGARLAGWWNRTFASTPNAAAGPGDEARAPGLLARLSNWFGGGGGSPARALPPGPPQIPPVVPGRAALPVRVAPAIPERGGFFDFVARFFRRDEAARTGGEQQRDEYLDDLRRRFSMGDLAEALRRAIPLNNQSTGAPLTGGFSPFRRDSLSLLTPNATGGATLGMAGDQFEAMRKLYREAADQLIAKGQIEEAAFVLARLLNDATAAVALLEKHGKLELAAQVATAQHLPEVERIRLWLLAGRRDEAIRIARASESFESLVTALTPRAPHLATQLRVIWGEFLGQRQRFTEALVATAPLVVPPPEWETWRDHAVATGGAAAVTAVAADLGRFPTHTEAARTQLAEVLDAEQALAPVAAQALLTYAPKSGGSVHRDLWRRLMRDASEGRVVDRSLIDRVLRASGDGTLQIDAVTSAAPPPLATREALEVPAPAVASLPVLDVAPLPKGRRALALGAAGLKVVNSTGDTLRHHLVKADAMVVGPLGTTVLVLSLDGALTRVWRLDPFTFALTSWFQGTIDAFSRRSDGLCWAVGMEESLVLLDPSTAGPLEWWRVPRFAPRVIDAVGQHVIALGSELALNESRRMIFDVGAQKLERRLDPDDDGFFRGATLLTWTFKLRMDARVELSVRARTTNPPTVVLPAARWETLALEAGLVLWRSVGPNTEVNFLGWSEEELRARTEPRLLARLWGARQVTVRALDATRLALLDEHGRVTEVSL